MSRRPCYNDQSRYCDRYEQRYSPKVIADLNKNAGEKDVVQRTATNEENVGDDKVVTLPCIGSDTHDVVYPNDGDNHEVTLPNDGTIPKHIQSVSYVDQDMDPKYSGPSITDDNYSGRNVHTTTDIEPGAAEVLPSEMTHGMSQIGVPHSIHATFKSVCEGVDADAHKNFNGRQVHCCCCMRAAYYMEDWMDHLEDETLFGCLFETGENSHDLGVAQAGVATAAGARNDKPRCLCGNGSCTNSPS